MTRTGFKTVDQYLKAQPKESQAVLKRVRETIRRALPRADETISYQIPAYKQDGRTVVYFAGWKEHFSLYPVGAPIVAALGDELTGYAMSKGTLRIPLDERVPIGLIRRIVKVLAKAAAERPAQKRR